ncbi:MULTISPECIES: hypothetical protein [Acinetobacter]|jgi:hypothetical protein|uniref:Uncharacterized protein n=1 Tax=Acinetobacter radioresistens TaxID=40216 RepID=A0A8H2K4V7_ACIRA|nr:MULTISPECIES: hypothetical protein [Acinetobacter]ENV88547.1 hypothetical protein F939_01261 [Acinetobacter radioresistens DSM 6976 = NBRC 102413 = CIP 103788]EXB33994.1 hypothetical protein J546_1284 [Acinetobacter sp. 1461402]EXB73852.1 hypothetical protein J550_0109 [Acinetobacter sp. 230853]EXC27992.1 hypothetical protein J520_2786 [Acinetobacter sp. 869535]EXE14131.1 hypothetical protein J559_1791 [Acinetobacter sp. 983759]
MNLFEVIKTLKPTTTQPEMIPDFLYGAFRRKSISFFNGLTDENTIVYWFQSRSFTIDLRLKSQTGTAVQERQGWIGNTLWDSASQLLSWEVKDYANYQNHVQWPEPAKLHAIGNCILEFSPSHVYVEDWRQQVQRGLFLSLRLQSAIEVQSGQTLEMDGGLIICADHIAYALTRLPEVQSAVAQMDFKAVDPTVFALLESFEVSIGTDAQAKTYSTRTSETGKAFNLENFEVLNESSLIQRVVLDDRKIDLIFELDIYQPDYHFQYTTSTTTQAENWLKSEQDHLMHHAERVL